MIRATIFDCEDLVVVSKFVEFYFSTTSTSRNRPVDGVSRGAHLSEYFSKAVLLYGHVIENKAVAEEIRTKVED
eukprot:911625-Pleurochrysis_carterae.AAC.2